MAAVGELGAGVAHEINNPLAAVLGSAQLALLRSDKADTRVRPHLEDIEKEALRIRDIVESLLKLSQDQAGSAMGTVEQRRKFIDAVRKACRIAKLLNEHGVRQYGVIRIDSATGTKAAVKKLRDAKIDRIPIDRVEVVGRVAAKDVIDPETGEMPCG
jgi:signal transduction histidine kinase